MSDLNQLQDILKYQYQDIALLEKALTHRSYLNENPNIDESNERLEYLGDAVLELITSEFLYNNYPKLPEGNLTGMRSRIVQTKTLATVAEKVGLGEYLKLSKGEAASGGHTNHSLLADLVEAIIGSIFLDSGLESANKFITHHILQHHKTLIQQAQVQDWKSSLQELVQAKGGSAPTYEVIKEKGPDHDRIFTVQVHYFDQPQATGTGRSKQSAQQKAAQAAFEKLKN